MKQKVELGLAVLESESFQSYQMSKRSLVIYGSMLSSGNDCTVHLGHRQTFSWVVFSGKSMFQFTLRILNDASMGLDHADSFLSLKIDLS